MLSKDIQNLVFKKIALFLLMKSVECKTEPTCNRSSFWNRELTCRKWKEDTSHSSLCEVIYAGRSLTDQHFTVQQIPKTFFFYNIVPSKNNTNTKGIFLIFFQKFDWYFENLNQLIQNMQNFSEHIICQSSQIVFQKKLNFFYLEKSASSRFAKSLNFIFN